MRTELFDLKQKATTSLSTIAAILCFAAASGPAPASATGDGTASGGGGKGFVCREADGSERVYLADTYDLVKSGAFNGFVNIEAEQIAELAADILDQNYPAKIYPHPELANERLTLGSMLIHTVKVLSFDSDDHEGIPNQRLPDFPDDHISKSEVPKGCRKIQLAIQNLKTHHVALDVNTAKLTPIEMNYLILHEALVAIRNMPNTDTTPIRAQLKAIAEILTEPKLFLRDVFQKMEDKLLAEIEHPETMPVLKTLLRMPRVLDCRLGSVERDPQHFRNHVENFKIVRISGTGRVGEKDQYEWVLPWYTGWQTIESADVRDLLNDNGVLKTNRYHGWLEFGTSFQTKKFQVTSFEVFDYSPRTQEFYGHVTTRNIDPNDFTDLTIFGYSEFKISCYGGGPGDLEFGYDSKASKHKSLNGEPEND